MTVEDRRAHNSKLAEADPEKVGEGELANSWPALPYGLVCVYVCVLRVMLQGGDSQSTNVVVARDTSHST